MKKIIFLFFIIVICLGLSLNSSFSQTMRLVAENFATPKKEYIVDSVSLFSFVENKENEAKIEAFFKKRGLPLYKNAAKFVEAAEKNGLDPFFLPTISILESSGGIAGSRATQNNNPFGWGSLRIKFISVDQAIDSIAYKLANLSYYKGKNIDGKLSTYNKVNPNYKKNFYHIRKLLIDQKIDSIDYRKYIDSFKIEIYDPVENNSL